ncbi:MAG: type II toxin-antitoxin system VapC family toxin [Dehalococcoidia bacterium]
MVRYLLDTNVLSDVIRDPQGSVAQRLAEHAEADLFTSIIVACELRYGAAKRGSPALTQRIDQLLTSLEVAALEPGIDEAYGRIRADLERQGRPVGANDLLIAAHAVATEAILVTHNVDEFRRISGLKVEDWLG